MGDPSDQSKKGTARIWYGCIFVGSAWILTLFAVLTSNSVAILADFTDSTLQLFSLILSWYVDLRISRKQSPLYTYGPGKIEGLTALVIGVVFLISAIALSIVAFNRFMHPQKTTGTGVWIVMFFSLVFALSNAYLFIRTRKENRERKRSHLDAESRIYVTKSASNGGLFLAITLSTFQPFEGAEYMDPLFSCIVICLMIFNMVQLYRKNLPEILDESINESSQLVVTKILTKHFDAYDQYCGMRSRYSGNRVFIEVFLQFDARLSMEEVLKRIKNIEKDIRQYVANADVTIVCSDGSQKGGL